MSVISAVFQAIIQGLTEFLPVSSSGHLSLFQHFTGQSGEGALLFSAVLHLGTLVAVFAAFYKTIWELIQEFVKMLKDIFTGKFSFKNMNPDRKVICMMVLSLAMLIPFYIFKDFFQGVGEDLGAGSVLIEGICFLYTAGLLLIADKSSKGTKTFGDVTVKDSLTVGFFQGIALLPGVSRSGSTIASGLFCGFSRDTAVKYSLILGTPPILGGCLLEVKDSVSQQVEIEVLPMVVGFVIAAIVGLLAIRLVQWLLKTDKFKMFAYYTAALGAVVILISVVELIMGEAIVFGA